MDSALTPPLLKDKGLRPGDEVVTAAAGFPTTVNPIIRLGLIPVFIDVELGNYNIMAERLEKALIRRIRAIFLPLTLGNPFDLDTVMEVAGEYDLFLLEDCSDALGSVYKGRRLLYRLLQGSVEGPAFSNTAG